MPELPEVETVRRVLEPRLLGRRFIAAVLEWPATVVYPSAEAFRSHLPGRAINTLDRRGKFLIVGLDDSSQLIAHLRMTGSLQLWPQDAPLVPYTRNRLLLSDGEELRFVDLRKFGQLWLIEPWEHDLLPYRTLGPEPLAPDFTSSLLAERLQQHHRAIKATLLDQTVVAGLGNIYTDEALWEARLHPAVSSASLSTEAVQRLHVAIISVIQRGIANLGTSYRDFVGPLGVRGSNFEELRVWGRAGALCPRCGRAIAKIRCAGRGTHVCLICQLDPSGHNSAN